MLTIRSHDFNQIWSAHLKQLYLCLVQVSDQLVPVEDLICDDIRFDHGLACPYQAERLVVEAEVLE